MFLNTLLRMTVAGSVVFCGTTDRIGYLWIPLLAMLIFLIRGLATADGDAERVDLLATQIYFLAFSATLSALLGLLGRVYLAGKDTDNLGSVEMMGAVALVTTLFGVLGMMVLREYAQKLADEGSPLKASATAPTAASHQTPMTAAAVGADASFEKMADLNRKATELIGRIVEYLEKLPVALDSVGVALRRAHGCGEEFVNDVHQMNSILDEFEKLQKRVLDVGARV